MKYTMMSYTMSRQPGFSLREMFELTLELGLAGVDMVTLYDRAAPELRHMADDYGVPIVMHTICADITYADEREHQIGLDVVKRGVEAAVALGAPGILITTPGRPELPRELCRRRWIAILAEAVEIAERAGIVFTVESFPGERSPFICSADFREAQREVPALRYTFDDGNASVLESVETAVAGCAPWIVHAHFKDWYIADSDASGAWRMGNGRYYRAALIGDGAIDHAGALRALRTIGYQGCINIEYEGDDYPAPVAIRRAVGWLRELEEVAATAV